MSILQRANVLRLYSNTRMAQKLPFSVHPLNVAQWASETRPDTLKYFYWSGSLELDELEGLLDYALRSERVE